MRKFALMLFLVGTVASAQKIKVISGDFKNLKSISEYKLEFDYEGLKVDKFKTEDEFLADKMKKREEKGKDEDFRRNWFADRQNRYEPKFEESFNKRFDGKVKAGRDLNSAQHTMKIKTSWIYPGYNVGVMRHDAEVSVIITVFETANPANIVLEAEFLKARGEGNFGFDFNSGDRIAEGYAKIAKELAKKIK